LECKLILTLWMDAQITGFAGRPPYMERMHNGILVRELEQNIG